MKKLLAFLLLGFGLDACQQQPAAPLATDRVNVLVGNAGYLAATGQAPTVGTNDDARVQAHLAYAEQLLRHAPTAGLSPTLARRRGHLLDLLHQYWVAGVFPRNYDFPGERRPCFIDRFGRLCAVGYLVAETAGRPVAERINEAHQYALIADMRLPALGEWVKKSGLTKAECALIQPTYGPTVAQSNSYAVGSAVWSGVNVMLGAANASQYNQPVPGRGVAWAGVLSGAGQVLVGALRLPPENNYSWGGTTYDTQRNVSYLNIGLGTATAALSAWNLLHHHPNVAARTAVNVVRYPGAGTGLALTRRF